MTVLGGSRRDTFTASLMPWRAAAAIGEDSERKSELRMGHLPSAFGRGCVKTQESAFQKKYFLLRPKSCGYWLLPTTPAFTLSLLTNTRFPLWKNGQAF